MFNVCMAMLVLYLHIRAYSKHFLCIKECMFNVWLCSLISLYLLVSFSHKNFTGNTNAALAYRLRVCGSLYIR